MELVKKRYQERDSMTVRRWSEEHGMQLFIISIAMLIGVLLSGCGTESSSEPPAPTPPPPADPAFDEVKPVIQRNCGKCHNGSYHSLKFDTAARFKGSKAKLKITDRSMPPPPNVMSDQDRQKLLAYLGR